MHLLLDVFPFYTKSIVLLLTSNMVVALGMIEPCAFRKFQVHGACPIA